RGSRDQEQNGGGQLGPTDKIVIVPRAIECPEIGPDRVGLGQGRKGLVHDLWDAGGYKGKPQEHPRKCRKKLGPPAASKRNVKRIEDMFKSLHLAASCNYLSITRKWEVKVSGNWPIR